jgi:hypothetical protein
MHLSADRMVRELQNGIIVNLCGRRVVRAREAL